MNIGTSTPFIGDIKDVKFYHGEDLPSFNKYYEIFSTTVEDFKKQDKKAIITLKKGQTIDLSSGV